MPRYDLPYVVIENALQGGVNNSLNLDGHRKTLSFVAITIEVCVSFDVLAAAKKFRSNWACLITLAKSLLW